MFTQPLIFISFHAMLNSRNLSFHLISLYSHHRPIYIFNHATSQYICYHFSLIIFLVKNTSKGLRSNCCPFSSYSTPPYNDQILSVAVGVGVYAVCVVCVRVCVGVCGVCVGVWGVRICQFLSPPPPPPHRYRHAWKSVVLEK